MSTSVLARASLVGLALAAVEVAIVVAFDRSLFLSEREIWRYAALSLAACSVLALVGGTLGRLAVASERRATWGAGLAALTWALWALFALTEGRRLRDLPGREALVATFAALASVGAALLTRALLRRRAAGVPLGPSTLGLALVAGAALVVDAAFLRRLYPAFHWSLATAALVAALAAGALPRGSEPLRGGTATALVGMALALAAGASLPWQLRALVAAPNVRFAVEESAPLTGKLLRLARPSAPMAPAPAVPAESRAAVDWDDTGVDLRGKDVLLVSIDALRADRLRRLGGSGVTPRLDELAEESVLFRRAYTTTPHTSYALAGLLTGKYVGELARLGEASLDHVTLPDLLRVHGFRTAAFYPPAIFFVDEPRFQELADRRFGFEYTKRMYASAHDRVGQLGRYLESVPAGHPSFVWVHLFEPHEPYDPPPRFERGDSPAERYDGEVATADDAAGELVALFRRARPGATVIVLSDHGEELGDHGGYHHGTTLYDEQVRIPLVWSSPGLAPHVVDAPVETVDVATTLLAALGIPRDARMRGDDLGPLLAGRGRGPTHAFASVGDERMATDGRHKAICRRAGPCRVFDLGVDPRERDDLSVREPAVIGRLQGALAEHVGALARFEALAMRGGGAWPEVLARAHLGDATAAPALVSLLGDARAEVRAAAARAAGELGLASARVVLARMREEDADVAARAEAALAAWRLGDRERQEVLRGWLAGWEGEPAFLRRLALAFADAGEASAAPVLRELARDGTADETERLAAIRVLGRVGGASDVDALVELLAHVRLRPLAAEALGALGDRRAVPPLVAALEVERYPAARTAEARALLALGARTQAIAQVRRFLGTESGIPDGVAILLEARALGAASGGGADLRVADAARLGDWRCDARGCVPGDAASVLLPARNAMPGPARAVVRVDADAEASLRVDDAERLIAPPVSELSFDLLPVSGSRTLRLGAMGSPRLLALAVVPVTVEIPPPPPVPWSPDAGAP